MTNFTGCQQCYASSIPETAMVAMVPFAMQLEAAEAAAAGAAAAAVSLGASPAQVARAVLVAMRALPIAAAQLQTAQVFDLTCGEKDTEEDCLAAASGSDSTSCGEPASELQEQDMEKAVADPFAAVVAAADVFATEKLALERADVESVAAEKAAEERTFAENSIRWGVNGHADMVSPGEASLTLEMMGDMVTNMLKWIISLPPGTRSEDGVIALHAKVLRCQSLLRAGDDDLRGLAALLCEGCKDIQDHGGLEAASEFLRVLDTG